jgi:ABC-2 type transport system permease protein
VTGRPPRADRPLRAGHTWRVLRAGWKADLAGAAEYRADLVIGSVVTTIWLGISVAPVLVVALHTEDANGWTLPKLLFLQAVWYLLDALVWAFLIMNVGYWEERVRLGLLDGQLLRPVNSLVLCSLGRVYVPDLPKVALAVGLGTVAVVLGGGPVGWLQSLAAAASIASALVLVWAMAVLANYKALTHVRFDGWAALFAAQNLARVPVPFYGPVLRVVLTVVVPVAFLATVPAQLFYGDAAPWLAVVSVVLAVAAVRVTSFLWRREVARYAGAMG